MFKNLTQLAVIISVICIASSSNAGSVPSLVNYQGKLTDANGNGLNETKTIECSIYDSAAATGNIVWGPQVFTNISVVNGMFNVILGNDSNGKSISDAFSSDARYLSIKVGGVEITPRQQILSSPYAINAKNADNGVPVGTILPFGGTTAPMGFFFCDGTAISRTTYTNLFKAIGTAFGSPDSNTFNVPDLRGLFLRGVGQNSDPTYQYEKDGSAQIADRTIGSKQLDEFGQHTHLGLHWTGAQAAPFHATIAGGNGSITSDYTQKMTSAGGKETRPKNIAVNYIIKY